MVHPDAVASDAPCEVTTAALPMPSTRAAAAKHASAEAIAVAQRVTLPAHWKRVGVNVELKLSPPLTIFWTRSVIGHSSRPLYTASGPVGARLFLGKGPAANLGAAAETFIASRFHVSICMGDTWYETGDSMTYATGAAKPW